MAPVCVEGPGDGLRLAVSAAGRHSYPRSIIDLTTGRLRGNYYSDAPVSSATEVVMVRVKSRYLLCEIHVSDPSKWLLMDDRAIRAAVKDAVETAHGDYGASQCCIGFSVKYVNAHTGILFLRCPKSSYRLIWSALPFITSIEHKRGGRIPCFLNCLHVGGTIRTCQKFLIQYNTQQLHRMLPKCKTPEEKAEVRRAILCSATHMLTGEEVKD